MTLRIGCVKYLNARPLIHGWPGQVVFDHPAALCAQLARGDLEVALVSSFEFLRNPIYRIVDGISISSDGPVYSVVLAHAGEISEIEEIEHDPASATSVNLLRCLLAESQLAPRVQRSTGILSAGRADSSRGEPVGPAGVLPAESKSISIRRARLIIGDQAIRFRQEHATEFRFLDLGEQWKKLVDLPFVYALWLVRPEVADPAEIANRLRALRDDNLDHHLDRLIIAEKEFDPEFCARYYREHLRFGFGEREKESLLAFADLCAGHGLLPKRDLALNLV